MKKFIVLFVVMFSLFSFCYATEWGIGSNQTADGTCFAVRVNWSKNLSSELTLNPNYTNNPTYIYQLNYTSVAIGIAPINYAIYSDENVRINTGIRFMPVISYDRSSYYHTNMTAIHEYYLSLLAPEIDFKVIGGLHLIATTSLDFYWTYAQDTKKCNYFSVSGTTPYLFSGLGLVYYFGNNSQKAE